MKIKRFVTDDVRQGMNCVRSVLGPDAVILSNTRVGRHVMVGGMSGVENDVIPFDDYKANIAVTGDASSATVNWNCTFDEGGMAENDAKAMISGSYENMLNALAAKLEA